MLRKALFSLVFFLVSCLITLLIFVVIEGFSSIYVVFDQVPPATDVAERAHTEYDPELGWINLPDVQRDDHYGPGQFVKINSQGFRANKNYAVDPPAGKVRFICSGDSFTMGYGVDNNRTWPAYMQSFNDRLQVVNMGQGGYGVDQSYLWYKRDGLKLKHQVHVFAFFVGDYHRMSLDTFNGYPKPYFADENGKLVLKNVPVPEVSRLSPNVARYLGALQELRVARIIKGFSPEKKTRKGNNRVYPLLSQPIFDISKLLFADLVKISKERDITLVALWLPFQRDYKHRNYDAFRKGMSELLEKTGVRVIDLTEPFRAIPAKDVDALFIQHDIKNYVGSKGHYTAKGNEFFARLAYERLMEVQPIKEMLAR